MPGMDRPESVSQRLVELLDADDFDGAADLYEQDAIFVDLDTTVRGTDAIREAHRAFREAGLTLRLNDSVVFEADDLALVHWSWTVVGGDGSGVDGSSAEVLRRQSDGTWKFLIDNSDGPAVLGVARP